MANFGKIKSYNSTSGTGFIGPEDGKEPIPFRKGDMVKDGEEPTEQQRVRYEVENDKQGEPQAVKLVHA